MTRPARAAAILGCLALLAGCSQPDTPRVEGPLAIEILDLCTVCVEVLRCEGKGRQTAYVLDEKGAWGQIITIWAYFADVFRPRTEDFRGLTVYELADDQTTVLSKSAGLEARLDVWNRRVELPDAVVDQSTGNWLGTDGRILGTCVHLAPNDGRALAAALASTSN